MNTWSDNSEIVSGLALAGRITPSALTPDIFIPPYDDLIRYIQKNGTDDVEGMIEKIGLSPVQAAHEAAKTLNGLGDANWVSILENSALNYDAAIKLERFSKKMKNGEEAQWPSIESLRKRYEAGISNDLISLSKIKRGEVPFIEIGWSAFDRHTMGIPEVGVIVAGGNPGVGKTTFAIRFSSSFARKYTEKQVAFFSIEMILQEIALRFDEVDKLPMEVQDRIKLCERPVTPEDVISKASTVDNLGLIVIDFSDLMISGETTESQMAHIYRTLMIGAKELRVPILLLSQLNRYDGGIPKPYNLRYTGLAEALSWMIIMLYNANTDWHSKEDDSPLPVVKNTAYAIIWKVRGGFRAHQNESPGAIMMPFRGDKGWHPNQSKWYSLQNEE